MHGEMRNAYKILVKRSGRKGPFGGLGIDGKILEWISGKYGGKVWSGSSGSGSKGGVIICITEFYHSEPGEHSWYSD
jgi:hypothetical protein